MQPQVSGFIEETPEYTYIGQGPKRQKLCRPWTPTSASARQATTNMLPRVNSFIEETPEYTYIGQGPKRQKLCRLCASLGINFPRHLDEFTHQPSFPALKASADNGCNLCQLLKYALLHQKSDYWKQKGVTPDDIAFWYQQAGHETESGPGECFKFSEVLPGENQHRGGGSLWYDATNHFFETYNNYWPPHVDLNPGDVPDRVSLAWQEGPFENHTPHLLAPYPSFDICAQWLRACTGSAHPDCPALQDAKLPTRVISVGRRGDPNVLLVESEGRKGIYATLSYQWGGKEQQFQTTQENISQRLNGTMSMTELPLTFQDAVVVTRQLGISYLWIDMLCIIQDSERDWQHECSNMDCIYELSSLTISAQVAANPADGFLRFRDQSRASPCIIPGPWPRILSFNQYLDDLGTSRPKKSPLDSRGWILQEKLLSPRVIAFGEHEMYFDCRRGRFLETTSDFVETTSAGLSNMSRSVLYNVNYDGYKTWQQIVEAYSSCDLTRQSDTLPALSGIARRFKLLGASVKAEPGEYAAGLWTGERYLAACLLWYCVGDPKHYPVRRSPCAPSWSWASSDRPVRFLPYSVFEVAFEVVQCNVRPSGLDQFGDVEKGAWLEAEAHIQDNFYIYEESSLEDPDLQIPEARFRQVLHLDIAESGSSRKKWLGVPGKGQSGNLSAAFLRRDTITDKQYCIVLETSSPGRYRRVGVCEGYFVGFRKEDFVHKRLMKRRIVIE